MTAAGAVNGVNPLGILHILYQLLQEGRSITGQSREGGMLPEPSKYVGFDRVLGVGWPAVGISGHDDRVSVVGEGTWQLSLEIQGRLCIKRTS